MEKKSLKENRKKSTKILKTESKNVLCEYYWAAILKTILCNFKIKTRSNYVDFEKIGVGP